MRSQMAEEPEGSGRRREALGTHACSTLASSSITQPTMDLGSGGGEEGRQRKESIVMLASVLIFSSLAGSNLKELVHLGSSVRGSSPSWQKDTFPGNSMVGEYMQFACI